MNEMQPQSVAARAPVQVVAMIIAAVFLLVGILGFIPGITTDYDTMTFAGHHSSAMLLGVFAVSVLHNLVHVLFGLVGFALARSVRGSRMFLLVGGAIYLVLWLYGLIIDLDTTANFVPFNEADNWLHFGLGFGMVLLGAIFSASKK